MLWTGAEPRLINQRNRRSIRLQKAFRSASQTLDEAMEACREPGMPFDTLSRLTRQAPLHALTIAFLVGVLVMRRR
jgi:hypothetical protein